MHNFLSRFRRGTSSATVTDDHKKSKSNRKGSDANAPGPNTNTPTETYNILNQKNVLPSTSKTSVKATIPNQSKSQQFTITLPLSGKKPSLKDKKKRDSITEKVAIQPAVISGEDTHNANKKLNVFGMIIDPIYDGDAKTNDELNSSYFQIFDPEPAPAETNTSNQITFIDDRNFIYDDEDKLSQISQKIEGLAKENNVFTVNEVPEGRLSRLSSKSSRASSVGSDSTRASSNFLSGDQASSDNLNSSAENITAQNGSKNVLLDALIKKFNVSMDLDTNDNLSEEKANTNDSMSETSGPRTSIVKKVPIKFHGEEHKRKQQSELQRKINRTKNNSSIAEPAETNVDATSSFDDDPKQIKVMKSSSTQITRTLNKRQGKNFKTVSVTRLPQHFECKYIGKTRCTGLWGLKHIRDPVDYLVMTSRQLQSLDQLPNVEALISEKGIYIVQKSKSDAETNLKEAFSPILSTSTNPPTGDQTQVIRSPADETTGAVDDNSNVSAKYYQSGLLPISNISYAVQDNVFGKVFSCIIVRECAGTTISECYSFLCKQNEMARRMALSITLAFKEYGKLLQLKETRINRKIEIDGGTGEKGDSFV